MAESYIARLKDLRSNLLHLHKALVDLERKNYEQNHGKVSSNNFLQLLINNDQFAWLRFLSEMIVEIDEVLDAKEPVGEEQAAAILSNARKLLNPSTVSEIFDTKYREALQNDPTVVMAHQAVRETLK
jgi:hypothetical protein